VLNLLQTAQHGLIRQLIELLATQVIVAAFHVADLQLALAMGEERLLKKRNILVEELLLQVLGAGGDDDPFARANSRHQIRQGLASPGAGFHDEMPLFFERLLDPLRHLQLSPAEFISRMGARKHAAGSEELVERTVLSLGPGSDRGYGLGG
jgi:hypothetical protein